MDHVQFINADKLDDEYLRVSANDAGMVDARRFNWLSRNMKNRVLSHTHKLIDAELDNKTLLSSTFEVELDCFVTARDLLVIHASRASSTRFNFKRLDLFRLTEKQREAYLAGAAMIGFANLTEHGEKCRHLCDALEANLAHKKNWTSVTPEAAEEIAEAWVKRLARQKLETAGTCEVVEELDGGLTLVKLLDEDAYKAEGALMHHCVGTYWGAGSAIYSLREDQKRLVTIEINKEGFIVQARGPRNAAPTEEQDKILAGVYERHGFRPKPKLGFADIRGLDHGLLHNGMHGLLINPNIAPFDVRGPRGDVGHRGPPQWRVNVAEGNYVLPELAVVDDDAQYTLQVVNGESTVNVIGNMVEVRVTVLGGFRFREPANARVQRNGVQARIISADYFMQASDHEQNMRTTLVFTMSAALLQQFYQGGQ